MELDKFQEEVTKVTKRVDSKLKGKHDVDTTFVHLIEELGEVARQIYNLKIGRDTLDKENLAEEISDCMILLAQLAHNFDINIQKSIESKLKKLYEHTQNIN